MDLFTLACPALSRPAPVWQKHMLPYFNYSAISSAKVPWLNGWYRYKYSLEKQFSMNCQFYNRLRRDLLCKISTNQGSKLGSSSEHNGHKQLPTEVWRQLITQGAERKIITPPSPHSITNYQAPSNASLGDKYYHITQPSTVILSLMTTGIDSPDTSLPSVPSLQFIKSFESNVDEVSRKQLPRGYLPREMLRKVRRNAKQNSKKIFW